MSNAVLVDTNVLVYAAERSDARRHAVARAALLALGPGRIAVSAQVLAEFANVLTHPRKLARPAVDAVGEVERLARFARVLPLDSATVIAALRAREQWGLEYYDAQIWAAAALNDVHTVLSEDFDAGAVMGGVRFVDPFAPGFDPISL